MQSFDSSRLRLLYARWILDEIWKENIPEACVELLTAGYDTPTLRILAGLTEVEFDEIPDLLTRMFSEMNLTKNDLSKVQAGWYIAHDIAEQIDTGAITPYEGAYSIGELGRDLEPLFPRLKIFIGLWSEWEDCPEFRLDYEEDIRISARELLMENPPAEPGSGSDIDHLVQLASQRTQTAKVTDMTDAVKQLVEMLPVGHLLNDSGGNHTWAKLGTHHNVLAMLVHRRLPFGFVRGEYRKFIQSVIDSAGLCIADISSADSVELSVTPETIRTLAQVSFF